MLQNFLWVACGGVFGACLRYGIELVLLRFFVGGYSFLLGVFSANMLGCFLAGLLFGWLGRYGLSEGLRLFFAVGFLGSLTTFSALVHQGYYLLGLGDFVGLFFYLVLSFGLGLLLFFIGGWLLQ